jgi:hypothetical protein
VGVREVSGRSFYYRQYYDAVGKKGAEYLGAVGSEAGEARAEAARQAIAASQELVKEGRMLGQSGYVRVDARTGAILGAVANRGLFRAGALLVGSHAYGALINDLGVRAAAFATEDVDIARGTRLDLELPEGIGFEAILGESTVPLLPVPGLDRKAPTTSYKIAGRDRLRVDLLTPTGGDEVAIRHVPELRAYAQAMPNFRPLLDRPIDGVVIGREGVVPVRVPRAEALAWHKVRLATMRGSSSDKRSKDVAQAAVLLAVLAEDAADAVRSGLEELPRGMRGATRRAAERVLGVLRAEGHARAEEVVRGALGR